MERTFSAGTIILEKNSVSNFLYVIVRGRVKFELDEKTFFLTDNDFFGEECVFLRKFSPYTTIASEETVIQIFNYQEAKDYVISNPKMFFALFVRNISRVWDGLEPVSEKNGFYIEFIERIYPFVTKTDCECSTAELGIMLEDFSSKLELEPEKVSSFISSVEHLGHIRLENNGKIYTVGKKTFHKLVGSYYESQHFGSSAGLKGCGLFPLINSLKSKESDVFNR